MCLWTWEFGFDSKSSISLWNLEASLKLLEKNTMFIFFPSLKQQLWSNIWVFRNSLLAASGWKFLWLQIHLIKKRNNWYGKSTLTEHSTLTSFLMEWYSVCVLGVSLHSSETSEHAFVKLGWSPDGKIGIIPLWKLDIYSLKIPEKYPGSFIYS